VDRFFIEAHLGTRSLSFSEPEVSTSACRGLLKGETVAMLYRYIVVIIGVAFAILGCSDNEAQQSGQRDYTNVSVGQFIEMMDHKDFILINTHIPYEGEIPGTDLLIPYNEIERNKSKLPKDKAARLVVYCKAGPMGDVAARKLVQMGYTHVIHFKAGMNGWEKAGRSLQFRAQ
jgi:rhodanese-related sulfurtransferase